MPFSRVNNDAGVFAELIDIDGKVVLDVGSGSGGFVAWLNQQGATAYGIECSDYMLTESRATFNEPHQIGGVGQQLPMATASAAVVTFMNSLHHVPASHMDSALAEAVRVLEPGGSLYVLEPVAEGPGYQTSRLIDDEAEVRALAQAAMDRAVGVIEPANEGRYTNRYVYRDVDAYFQVLVGVDASRAAQVEKRRDQVTEAFHRYGIETPDGMAFEHPMHYRHFTVNHI